ncbi:unnamed protein product [Oikopleura dioica]|uniref:Uncharacterized protein n=1 Tax=Oikopleura dioica TaxID=34765 RepID=E4XLL3_OIKDI|nr:unnamed protein product [Oikopleura dioica]
MENEPQNASNREHTIPETAEGDSVEIRNEEPNTQDSPVAEKEPWGETELEILKELVKSIEKNLNHGSALPQKAVAFNGATTSEKILNLTKEATRILEDSQELPPRALKILQKASEEGIKGFDMFNCFQSIARITQNDAIEMNRRTTSTNKSGIDKLKSEMYEEVQPRLLGLAKEVFDSEVFSSEELCNWARIMEPLETEEIPKDELKTLEKDIEWILTRLWGKAAGSIYRMILAKCDPIRESNSRSSQRMIMAYHIWNLRFKGILKLGFEDRKKQSAVEEDICIAISQAIHSRILYMITNTRCIYPNLLITSARTAYSHLNTLFGKTNPLSVIFQDFLANADSNTDFTIWEAIRKLRILWPARRNIATIRYDTLNLGAIDDRIEMGLENPDSLINTTYAKRFWHSDPRQTTLTGKRKRTDDDEDLGGNRGRNPIPDSARQL